MRRIIRGFLWLIKGMLLAIALAALVLWPMSKGRMLEVWASRYTAQERHINCLVLGAWCDNGQIAFGRDSKQCLSGTELERGRDDAELYGGNWHWEVNYERSMRIWDYMTWTAGPLRGWFLNRNDAQLIWSRRFYSAPCWLIGLATGAWPMANLGRLVHRRIRRRRAAQEGHCRVCGYDLRASPDRCPECGTLPEVKA